MVAALGKETQGGLLDNSMLFIYEQITGPICYRHFDWKIAFSSGARLTFQHAALAYMHSSFRRFY